MQQRLGVETRRLYIDTLSNSGLVTLEEIDRILKTHYSRLQDEREETPRFSQQSPPRRDRVSEREAPAISFATFESAAQSVLEYLGKAELQGYAGRNSTRGQGPARMVDLVSREASR